MCVPSLPPQCGGAGGFASAPDGCHVSNPRGSPRNAGNSGGAYAAAATGEHGKGFLVWMPPSRCSLVEWASPQAFGDRSAHAAAAAGGHQEGNPIRMPLVHCSVLSHCSVVE